MERRGHKFEHEIDKVLNAINQAGYHVHKNHPMRTTDGVYIEGEPFDYEAFMPDVIDVFDAKEVEGDRWHMKPKDIRQCNNLKQCKKSGCNAYFLILFNKKDVLKFDVDDVSAVLAKGSKTVGKEFGRKWDLIERLKAVL